MDELKERLVKYIKEKHLNIREESIDKMFNNNTD